MPFTAPQERMMMSKRKANRSAHRRKPVLADAPTRDLFEHLNLDDPGDLERALDDFTCNVSSGYFLRWEAVRSLAAHLPQEPFRTCEVHYSVTHEGWLSLVECNDDKGAWANLAPGSPGGLLGETKVKAKDCLDRPGRQDNGIMAQAMRVLKAA